MDNSLELAEIFDEWEKTLNRSQKAWCRRALRNAGILEHVGEASAKELIIAMLLFCDGKSPLKFVSSSIPDAKKSGENQPWTDVEWRSE
jgi:hypothetical protein